MAHEFAKMMFGEAAKQMQVEHGSRAAYARLEAQGESHDELGPDERAFIAARDSFYLASVTDDGWPYVQHRGGAEGFLRVIDGRRLAFADFGGNKQYITAGNLRTHDRVALFLMDYPQQARLKLIGHARMAEAGTAEYAELLPRVRVEADHAAIERIAIISLVAFDWNCSQHITPRWTAEEIGTVEKTNVMRG